MKYQKRISLDQMLNAWLFKGWADETISARAYRNSCQGNPKWKRFHKWIDRLFFWQKDHCKRSYESEVARLHVPPAYRTQYNSGASK